MAVPFVPSDGDIILVEKYKEYLLAWMECNPGKLCKIGGKQFNPGNHRHHDAQQYNPLYFDTSKAIVFPGTFTDSRQAAWLELMLMQFAYFLEIGVNKNRDSPYNMAVLTGESYSATNLGFIYLVPVHYHITTQDDFFEVYVSAHSKKKELIDGGDIRERQAHAP
jgi:hypothetical protein